MNIRNTLLCGLLSLAAVATSAEISLDDDLMQGIEDTTKSLTSNIALKDIKTGSNEAKELEQMFAKVEAYYQKKPGAEEGVTLSRKSRELSSEVAKALNAHDFAAANDYATSLSKTCKTCHTIYKKDA